MMDELPVCNYEGSDYQTSFWERGGRAYEDAVEAVALQRLLPKGGRRLLELGAGAGRNTPRYHGFEQIVLLDYSRTQLQQARQRLGETGPDGSRLTYVAADIYHLPFVGGVFDTATMIRTLHHMIDPRRTIHEVRQVLASDSIFVLEFANKLNLKSVLRYATGRQSWNPFSPEPVEFAALNFDFHPATVRTWLEDTGFVIERQLTVSHFRIGLLKRSGAPGPPGESRFGGPINRQSVAAEPERVCTLKGTPGALFAAGERCWGRRRFLSLPGL